MHDLDFAARERLELTALATQKLGPVAGHLFDEREFEAFVADVVNSVVAYFPVRATA
jgi:hypothetical protein